MCLQYHLHLGLMPTFWQFAQRWFPAVTLESELATLQHLSDPIISPEWPILPYFQNMF